MDLVLGIRAHWRLVVAVVLLAAALAVGVFVIVSDTGWWRLLGVILVVLVFPVAAAYAGGWDHMTAAATLVAIVWALVFLGFGLDHLGPVGTRHWHPSAAELRRHPPHRFDLAFGQGRIDLSALSCRKTQEKVSVTSRVDVGNLTVTVPAQAAIKGDVRVTFGRLQIFGRTDTGSYDLRVDIDKRPAKACANPQGGSPRRSSLRKAPHKSPGSANRRKPPVVALALSTGVGVLIVRRAG